MTLIALAAPAPLCCPPSFSLCSQAGLQWSAGHLGLPTVQHTVPLPGCHCVWLLGTHSRLAYRRMASQPAALSSADSSQQGTLPVVDQQPHPLYPVFSPGQEVLLVPGHPCRLFQRASYRAGGVQAPQWWILPSDFLPWSPRDPAGPQESQRTSS